MKQTTNAAWAIAEYGWYPLLLFAATPWILSRLASEQYGFWMLLLAIVALGGLISTGSSAATAKTVSEALARGQEAAAQRCVRAAIAIATMAGVILALLILSIYLIGGAQFFARMGSTELLGLTIVASALLICIEQVDSAITSALKGADRFALTATIEIASKSIQVLASAVVVLAWPRLWALYFALAIVAILRLAARATMLGKVLGPASLRPSLAGSGELIRIARWGWIQGVGGVLFGVADRVIVGAVLGSASLAYYSIATQLCTQIHALSAAGASALLPGVARALEVGDEPAFKRSAYRSIAANVIFSTVLAGLLAVFGPRLVEWWIGVAQADVVVKLLPWLVLAYWLLALNAAPYFLLLSLARFRFVSLSNLAAGLALIAILPLATHRYGLTGVALSRIVYGAVILVNLIPLLTRLKGRQRQ